MNRYSKEFAKLLIPPKEGIKYASEEYVQATTAEVIARHWNMNPEAIYNWAKKHNVNLVLGGYYLSNTQRYDLLTAVLNDTLMVDGYEEWMKKDKGQKNLKENIMKLKKIVLTENNKQLGLKKDDVIFIEADINSEINNLALKLQTDVYDLNKKYKKDQADIITIRKIIKSAFGSQILKDL